MISTRGFFAPDSRGRWPRLSRKTLVEDCLELCAGRVVGVCPPGGDACRGVLDLHGSGGDVLASAAFSLTLGPSRTGNQILEHGRTSSGAISYKVPLVATTLWRGGRRWWFKCPGPIGGPCCDRRVAKLFLAPAYDRFLCRACANLSYSSQRARPGADEEDLNPEYLSEEAWLRAPGSQRP